MNTGVVYGRTELVTSYEADQIVGKSNSKAIASILYYQPRSYGVGGSGIIYHIHRLICAAINLVNMPATLCRHDDEIYGSHG